MPIAKGEKGNGKCQTSNINTKCQIQNVKHRIEIKISKRKTSMTNKQVCNKKPFNYYILKLLVNYLQKVSFDWSGLRPLRFLFDSYPHPLPLMVSHCHPSLIAAVHSGK